MIPKDLQLVSEADLLALISNQAEEGVQLDFKRDLPKEDHEGRKAFMSDICAFANTSGGVLIYGMEEDGGVASKLISQALPTTADGYVLKLTSQIRDRIEPILQGVQIHPVSLSDGGHALVIRVQRSFSGIHRYKSDGQFYIRKSRSNEALDVTGIVSRISEQLGREDRVNSFFSRRYVDVLANEHPLPLAEGPKLVVHLVPVRDFLTGEQVDLDAIPTSGSIPFLNESFSRSQRNTFDGRAFFEVDENKAGQFTLFMRSGIVEACMDLIPSSWPEDAKSVDLAYVEVSVLQFLTVFQLGGFAGVTTGYPYVIKVALLGTNGLPYTSGFGNDSRRNSHGLPVRQPLPVLALPELLIETAEDDFVHLMHSTFLRMWHAWAYPKSLSYELKDGKWRLRKR